MWTAGGGACDRAFGSFGALLPWTGDLVRGFLTPPAGFPPRARLRVQLYFLLVVASTSVTCCVKGCVVETGSSFCPVAKTNPASVSVPR